MSNHASEPNVGPEATQGIITSTSGIDLSSVFEEQGGDGGSASNSFTLDGGGFGAHAGVDVGGGAELGISIPGGPELELGGHANFGTEGAFEAEGSRMTSESKYTTPNDNGEGFTSGDSSLDVIQGGVSAEGALETGAGVNLAFGMPGGPTVSGGLEGEFSTAEGVHAEGQHIDADSSFGPTDGFLA